MFRLFFCLFLLFCICSSNVLAGRTELISISTAGEQANRDSRYIGDVSADGRYVVFASAATTLVEGDYYGQYDIFRRDRVTGETILISKNSAGDQANGASYWPVVSDDGNRVAFFSFAANLDAADTKYDPDVFVRDVSAGTTILVSKSNARIAANGPVDSLAISGDGNVVAFASIASNLVADDMNDTWDVFLHILSTSNTSQVSRGNGASLMPTLSHDGRYVAYESIATNLVPGDTNGRSDIFVFDRTTDTTIRVSTRSDGAEAFLGGSTTAAISGDGNYVAFVSTASDLVGGDSNHEADVFLYDRSTGNLTQITSGNGKSQEVAISQDGSYLSFVSAASNLVPGDSNGCSDLFRYARADGSIERVSLGDDDAESNGRSYARGINSSGQYIMFLSYADNLVAGDGNNTGDIFLRDMSGAGAGTGGAGSTGIPATVVGGTTLRMNVGTDGVQADSASSGGSSVSDDGQYVVFASAATNLIADDTNGVQDVFLRNTTTGTTTLISAGLGGAESNGHCHSPLISGDGSVIAFISEADNLVADDTNGVADVFVYAEGSISRASVGAVEGNGPVDSFDISSNGQYIVFSSLADNLVPGDTNGAWDIFVCEVPGPAAMLTRVTAGGIQANGSSFNPSISDNGQLITYQSDATNLVAGDTNGRSDVFVYDTVTGIVERASTRANGAQCLGGGNVAPVICGNGAYIAFSSMGWDLFDDDFNGSADIVLHNRETKAVTRISHGAFESDGWAFNPQINSDGSVVAFECDASNLIAGDTNEAFDIFVYDNGILSRANVSHGGIQSSQLASLDSLSADGNLITLHSWESLLVPGDTNVTADIFLRVRDASGFVPDIKITGQGLEIASGDNAPDTADDTEFGDRSMTQAAITHTFTIENAGNNYLSLIGTPIVTLTGDVADFTCTQPTMALLDSHESTTFQVSFLPTATGLRSATVGIASDDADESSYSFVVQGVGTAPQISLTGDPAIGAVTLGNPPTAGTFTISNIGTYAMNLTGTPLVDIIGTNAADFSVQVQPVSSYAVGASDSFNILFEPTAAGIREATLVIASDDPSTPLLELDITGIGNQVPVADAVVIDPNVRAHDVVTLSGAGSYDPDSESSVLRYSWRYLSGPIAIPGPSLTPLTEDQMEVSFTPTVVGTYKFELTVSDEVSAMVTTTVSVVVTTRPRLITGTALASTNSWVDVILPYDYKDMVVVCTPQYAYYSGRPPMCVRIQNAESDSFQVKLTRLDDETDAVTDVKVHYLVVEAGTYTNAIDGITMEAVKYDSSIVARSVDWIVEDARTYLNTYTSPVTVGQIQTTNDESYQVFWTSGLYAHTKPSATVLHTGRHAGESPAGSPLSETIGYLVFESGASSGDGVALFAGHTSNLVEGMANGPYTQMTPGFDSVGVLLSSSGMHGIDGGFPVLNGDAAVGSEYFMVSIEEDMYGDLERAHTGEEVAYLCFGDSDSAMPIAESQTIETSAGRTTPITATGLNIDGSETWTMVTPPANGTFEGELPNISYTPNDGFQDVDTFTFRIDVGAYRSNVATISINVRPSNPFLMTGIASVSTNGWTRILLPRTFESMVVVTTPSYDHLTTAPMVSRIRNAVGNSFEVRMFRADHGTEDILNIAVHYAVMEVGAYTDSNGNPVEAYKFNSREVAGTGNWATVVSRSYHSTYTAPVILGQVMTTNDPQFQVFWANGGGREDAPTADDLKVGRHRGEDLVMTRADEDVAYIVFESGDGTLAGIRYEAGLTPNHITHNIHTQAVYSLAPEVALLSCAGLNGGNGGYPIIAQTPLSPGGIELTFEEDQLFDVEQYHMTEEVAYVTFQSSPETLSFAYTSYITYATPPFSPMLISGAAAAPAANPVVSITLDASNTDEDTIWSILDQPTKGLLGGIAPNLTYVADFAAIGQDSFTFKVTTDAGDSNVATVVIDIQESTANHAPIMRSVWAGPDPDAITSPANLEAVAWDLDDEPLSISWELIDGPGTVSFGQTSAALSLDREFVAMAAAPSASDGISRASFSKPGVYTLSAKATDGDKVTTREMILTVTNVPDSGDTGGSDDGGGGCAMSHQVNSSLLVLLMLVVAGVLIQRRLTFLNTR